MLYSDSSGGSGKKVGHHGTHLQAKGALAHLTRILEEAFSAEGRCVNLDNSKIAYC